MSTEPGIELDDLVDEPFLINLLFKSFRTLQKVVVPSVAARGHQEIGLSETRLLLSLGSGVTINRLAELTGASRQYVSRKVHELEAKRYVRTAPDSSDARSTRVEVDRKGLQYISDLREVKKEVDALTRKILGEPQLQALVGALQKLNGALSVKEVTR